VRLEHLDGLDMDVAVGDHLLATILYDHPLVMLVLMMPDSRSVIGGEDSPFGEDPDHLPAVFRRQG
jgi:hypothetical protein